MAPLLIGITMAFVLLIVIRPELTRARGGKILAFFPLFMLPAAAGALGGYSHLEDSKQTRFCLSCHVMTDYGKSLQIDDPSFIPAAHFQNHRIPTEEACYTCHTNYTMYGDVTSKLRGLRHVYVYYLGKVPAPAEIKLYSSYNNRECLHCHEGSRSFEENEIHKADPAVMASIKSNETSCMTCHSEVHDVGKLGERKFWQPAGEGKKP
jgi:cytochrome c-type protein NapC